MLPKFKPSFIGFSLQSVIHIRIDSNTSISKRSNTHVNKRIVGINAFHLKTCFAFSSSSVSHTLPPPLPQPVPVFRRTLVFLHCRNCFCVVVGWPWLPLDALQQCYFTLLKSSALLWQRCLRLELRSVCVATRSLFRCLT